MNNIVSLVPGPPQGTPVPEECVFDPVRLDRVDDLANDVKVYLNPPYVHCHESELSVLGCAAERVAVQQRVFVQCPAVAGLGQELYGRHVAVYVGGYAQDGHGWRHDGHGKRGRHHAGYDHRRLAVWHTGQRAYRLSHASTAGSSTTARRWAHRSVWAAMLPTTSTMATKRTFTTGPMPSTTEEPPAPTICSGLLAWNKYMANNRDVVVGSSVDQLWQQQCLGCYPYYAEWAWNP